MVEAMVTFLDRESHQRKGGRWKFRQLPRVGECVETMVAGLDGDSAHLFRVIAIHHPSAPASTVGDLYVVDVGETASVVEGYRKSVTRERSK